MLVTSVGFAALADDGIRFDQPVTLRLVLGSNEPTREGENYEDNVFTRWVYDKFNVKLEYLWTTSSSSYNEKLRLELAAGSPMPDILYMNEGSILFTTELIQSGMFREVGNLFEAYAGETWKTAMASEENAFLPYIVNGQIMAIPVLEQNMNVEVVMGIRDDWLREVGMEVPTTLAELEAVMEAFVTMDPDRNGADDTYALSCGLANGMFNQYGDMGWLFGMHETLNGYWNDWDDDGELEYGSVEPGAKQALAKLREWYEKGYIHKEVGMWGGADGATLFAQGKAGIIFACRYAFSNADAVTENDPGSSYVTAMIPVGPEGKVYRHGSRSTAGCWLINKDCKTPEAFLRVQDYLMTHYADPKEGGEFEFGMFEGYDYVMKDGKRSTSKSDFPEGQPRSRPYEYSFAFNGAKIPGTRLNTYYKMYLGEALTTPMEWQYAWTANPFDISAGYITVLQQDIRRENLFVAAPTKTMQSKGEYLNKLELETYLKIIYGELEVDAFDGFVEQWNNLGGYEITREVNEWYQSVKDVD